MYVFFLVVLFCQRLTIRICKSEWLCLYKRNCSRRLRHLFLTAPTSPFEKNKKHCQCCTFDIMHWSFSIMQDNQRRRYFSIRCVFCLFLYDFIRRIVSFVSDVKCEKQEPKPVHCIVQCLKLSNTNITVGVCDIHSSFPFRRPRGSSEKIKWPKKSWRQKPPAAQKKKKKRANVELQY